MSTTLFSVFLYPIAYVLCVYAVLHACRSSPFRLDIIFIHLVKLFISTISVIHLRLSVEENESRSMEEIEDIGKFLKLRPHTSSRECWVTLFLGKIDVLNSYKTNDFNGSFYFECNCDRMLSSFHKKYFSELVLFFPQLQ
jgi:hypothetical protein